MKYASNTRTFWLDRVAADLVTVNFQNKTTEQHFLFSKGSGSDACCCPSDHLLVKYAGSCESGAVLTNEVPIELRDNKWE